jgi:hypothetical protein
MERHLSAICSKCFRRIFSYQKMGLIHCDVVVNGDGRRMDISQQILVGYVRPKNELESLGVDYCILGSRNNKFLCYYIN